MRSTRHNYLFTHHVHEKKKELYHMLKQKKKKRHKPHA